MREGLKVALVHDWLTGMRGGEKVLEVLADMFPHAPIYTLLHIPGSVSAAIEKHPIHTSWLQRLPMARKKYRYYLPLMPTLIERLRMKPVDLVISTSSCVAKGIIPPHGAIHASYIHSPMRYLYDRYDDYFGPGKASKLTRAAMWLTRGYLQRWDQKSNGRIDALACNSRFVAERIRAVYSRPARVIHPPVEVHRFRSLSGTSPGNYYLMVTALVPYKNVDVALEAFRQLDRPLVVAGSGPLFHQLAAIAPTNVTLRGWVDDREVSRLVAGCRAFLMPNVEDFGIAPVEAMAAGRPVIALGEGGVRDSVRDLDRVVSGELPGAPTGLFYFRNEPRALAEAIRRFEEEERQFSPRAISAAAQIFDRAHFERQIRHWLESLLQRGDAQVAA